MVGRPFCSVAFAAAIFCPAALAAERQPPPAELLEFIAEFETAGGKAVDPLQFGATSNAKDRKKPTERPSTPKTSQERPAPVRTKGEKP